MTTEKSNEVVEVNARPTDTDVDVAETGTRADLVWDDEVPGLCVRVYGNGAKSFIFIYRRNDRQRFVRIGGALAWRHRSQSPGGRHCRRPPAKTRRIVTPVTDAMT
jgi:hypothetical protein